MTVAYLDSQSIANWDTVPVIAPTAGEGAADRLFEVDDYVSVTAVSMQSTKTALRLVRFPTGAKIKSVKIYSDGPLDSGETTLALDFNIAFSDANTSSVGGGANQGSIGDQVNDGTSASVAGQIPTSAGNAVTPVSTYTSPNKLFGTYTVQSDSAGIPWGTDITLLGATGLASNTYTVADMQLPMWDVLGFVNAAGNPQDPGGYFDLVAVVSTAATTGGAAKLWAKVEYSK